MQELLIATGKKGKLREIRDLLKDVDIKITSLADYSGLPEIIEDGKTFTSNAKKKALTIGKHTGKLVMGEDSGLEVKFLNDEPGVYSARYSGPDATDKQNNLKLLRELKGVPVSKRQARYRCFAALAHGGKMIDVVNGSCRGVIALEEKGANGFGYDSLFFIPKYNMTFGQIEPEIKAKMSHRYRALKKFKVILKDYLKKMK